MGRIVFPPCCLTWGQTMVEIMKIFETFKRSHACTAALCLGPCSRPLPTLASAGDSWFWERLRAGGEGDDRGWGGWMASLTRWTWVWVNSGNWWWTGRPGVLRFMGSQRVGHDWATELNWTELYSMSCGKPEWKRICKKKKEYLYVYNWVLFWWAGSCSVNI